jgi:hypothetical protein
MNILPLRNRSYSIPTTVLEKAHANLWIARTSGKGWLMAVVASFTAFFLSALLLVQGGSMLCFALFPLVVGLYWAVTYPLAAEACFNFAQGELTFTATYFLRLPRQISWCVPLTTLTGLNLPLRRHSHSAIHLTFQDGTRLHLEFDRRQQKVHHEFVQRLKLIRRKQHVSQLGPAPTQ